MKKTVKIAKKLILEAEEVGPYCMATRREQGGIAGEIAWKVTCRSQYKNNGEFASIDQQAKKLAKWLSDEEIRYAEKFLSMRYVNQMRELSEQEVIDFAIEAGANDYELMHLERKAAASVDMAQFIREVYEFGPTRKFVEPGTFIDDNRAHENL